MRALSTTLLGVVLVAVPAQAQKAHKYDPKAEVTVTGVVVDYHESKARNDHPGLHFILEIPGPPTDTPAGTEEVTPTTAAAAEGALGLTPEPTTEAETVAEDLKTVAASVETLEVHACPVRLLSQLDFPIEKGDELTVTGSRPGGGEVLIAREITKDAVSLQIRDEEGVPIWDGLP